MVKKVIIKMIWFVSVFAFFSTQAEQAEDLPSDSILLPLKNQEYARNNIVDLLRYSKKGERGPRGHRGPTGPTGAIGPKGATGATGSAGSSIVTAFALYYAKISEVIDEAIVGSPSTYGLVEFEQNPPNGADPLHANINMGGFTISTDDTTFPNLITSITVPLSGYYQIRVILSTAGAAQIALVKNIGPVTAGSFPFNGTVSSFTAINSAISAIAITTTPYQISNQTITQLDAGDTLAVINVNTVGPLALNSATTGAGSTPSGDSVSASIEIQYLGAAQP